MGRFIEHAHGWYFVEIYDDLIVRCRLSDKLKERGIKPFIGQEVRVNVSITDNKRGTIVYCVSPNAWKDFDRLEKYKW